jgi:hypothetical protein
MYRINTNITLFIPYKYYKEEEIFQKATTYIYEETWLDYEVLSISRRQHNYNNYAHLLDLKLLFTIEKQNVQNLVSDLQDKFMKLYNYNTKNIKILLNEVYVKLEKR